VFVKVGAALLLTLCALSDSSIWKALLASLIQLIDIDCESWQNLAPAVAAVQSPANGCELPAHVVEFDMLRLSEPTNGLLFAVASFHDAVRRACMSACIEFAFSDEAVPGVMVPFIHGRAMCLGENQYAGLDRLFARFDGDCGGDISNANHMIAHTCLPRFLASPDDLITPVIRVLPNVDTAGGMSLMMALVTCAWRCVMPHSAGQ
jgi:hypothetical protein